MIYNIKAELRRLSAVSPWPLNFNGPAPDLTIALHVTDDGCLTKWELPHATRAQWRAILHQARVMFTLPAEITAIGPAVFRNNAITVKTEGRLKFIGESAFKGALADTLEYIKIDAETILESKCFYGMTSRSFTTGLIEIPKSMTADQILASGILVKRYPADALIGGPLDKTFHNVEPWLMTLPVQYQPSVKINNPEQLDAVLGLFYPDGISKTTKDDIILGGEIVRAPHFDEKMIRAVVHTIPSGFNIDDDLTPYYSHRYYNPWKFARMYYEHPSATLALLIELAK